MGGTVGDSLVEGKQADARRRLEESERLRHVRAKAMLEDERQAGAGVLVMELNSVVDEEGHLQMRATGWTVM